MDDILGLRLTALLREARHLAGDVLERTPAPDDAADLEALGLLRQQLGAMDEAIGSAWPPPVRAAEPVGRAAGAILVLEVDRADDVADRLETIGDQIFRGGH